MTGVRRPQLLMLHASMHGTVTHLQEQVPPVEVRVHVTAYTGGAIPLETGWIGLRSYAIPDALQIGPPSLLARPSNGVVRPLPSELTSFARSSMPDAASLPRLALHRCGDSRFCLCSPAVWKGRAAGRSGAATTPVMFVGAATRRFKGC